MAQEEPDVAGDGTPIISDTGEGEPEGERRDSQAEPEPDREPHGPS